MNDDLGLFYASDESRFTFHSPTTVLDYIKAHPELSRRKLASQIMVFGQQKLQEFDESVSSVSERLQLLKFNDNVMYGLLGDSTWNYVRWILNNGRRG